MKLMKLKKGLSIMTAACLMFAWGSVASVLAEPVAQAAVDLKNTQGNEGAAIAVPLVVNSDGTAVALEMDVTFDSAFLTFNGVTANEYGIQTHEVSPGNYRLIIGNSARTAIPTGEFQVGTLNFTIADGEEYLATSNVQLTSILTSNIQGVTKASANDSATITVVDTKVPTLSLTPATTDFTTALGVSVTSSGTGSNIVMTKYIKGDVDAAKVKADGEDIIGNNFILTENGTYTVYVEDEAGNGTIEQITVDNVVLKGDADLDWDVDLFDWQKAANFILKKETPNARQKYATDMNDDNSINIGDWVQIAGLLLEDK